MTAVIKCKNLTKLYGSTVGVSGLNLTVEEGEVFGFLGPNGAGKTTTLRLLLDLIRPTDGQAEVLGLDTQKDGTAIRSRIGYLPGELTMYDQLTATQLLRHLSALRGKDDTQYVQMLAERLGLDLHQRISKLSKGNKQKVGLVQAFMHRPELLLLDEPTSGLDPLVQQTFYELIREVREEGRTVMLSSHNLDEVERIADRVAVIKDGQLAVVDKIAALKAQIPRGLDIHFAEPPQRAPFEALNEVKEVECDSYRLRLMVEGSLDPVIKLIANYEVVNLVSHDPDLEEVFLTFYGREQHAESFTGADHH